MEFEREKAKLLAENLSQFVTLVHRKEEHLTHLSDKDKLYRLKSLVDEYRLGLLAKEIARINRFSWEPEMMVLLVNRVRTSISSIDDYMENNLDDLFFYSAKVHTIKSICSSFTTI